MNPPRSPFRERIGTYLLGVAIGCVIVGFIFMGRYQAKQHQTAQQKKPATSSSP